MDCANSSSEMFFHGTCRHCKHFHKNCVFLLSSNAVPVKCERCTRHMFRLGRADTQYSLASVDSLPLSVVDANLVADRIGCSDNSNTHSDTVPLLPSHHLSHRPQSHLEGQTTTPAYSQLLVAGTTPPETHPNISDERDGITGPPQNTTSIFFGAIQRLPFFQTLFGAIGFMNILGSNFAARLFNIRRVYSIFGWQIILCPPAHSAGDHLSVEPAPVQQSELAIPASRTYTNAPITTEFLDQVSATARSGPNPNTSAAVGTGVSHSGGVTPNIQPAVIGGSDRLSQLRRDKTIRQNALQRLKCSCTKDCHCIPHVDGTLNASSVLSDSDSNPARHPLNVDEVPSEPLVDRLNSRQFLGFSYMGNHIDGHAQPNGRSSDSNESSGRSISISQAPTLGSGSSTSLRPRRPRMMNTRSRSMPV